MYFLPLSSPIRREGAFVLTLLRHFPLSDDRSHFRVVESGSPKKEGGRARPNLMSRPILSRAWHLFLLRHAIFKRPRRWTISLFGPRRSRRGHAA